MDFSECVGAFEVIPYKNLKFITIKDNSNSTTMSNVIDWLRKYSNHYVLVRGLERGVHFHALLEWNSKQIRPKKGLHTYILDVGDKSSPLFYETKKEFYEDRLTSIDEESLYIYKSLVRLGFRYFDVIDNHINVIVELKKMFYSPVVYDEYKQRCVRLRNFSKRKKNKHIVNIVNYLESNYNENSVEDRNVKYLTYYYRCPTS